MKSRETLLIVDDSVESLNFLTDALEDAGFTVLVALNGLAAMTLVDRVAPDLVLMDAVKQSSKRSPTWFSSMS